LGAALAVSWIPQNFKVNVTKQAQNFIDGVGVFGFIGILASFLFIDETQPTLYKIAFPLAGIFGAAIVMSVVHPASRFAPVLQSPVLLWIGERSYSIYLWHWVIFQVTRPSVDLAGQQWALYALRILIVFALSDISLRYVELPIRRGVFQYWVKGLKYRTVGLAVDIFTELGASVNPLPGGEIVPALDRGLIDAAEFNNASSDRILGFPDVVKNCMLQSFHQSGEQFEILFNKGKLAALPAELKSIIEYAVQASSAEMSWKAIDRNSKDYSEMKKQGIKFYKTPDAILKAQLEAWDKVVAKKSLENPYFKKVMDSQMAFAERAGQWQNDYMVDFKMAYNRYFSKAAPKKA
jgi:hypothetical protein